MPQGSPESEVAGYRPLAFAIAYRMLGSVAEAEDIVQDAQPCSLALPSSG